MSYLNLFQKLTEEISPGSPGVRVVCPNGWTVRVASIKSVISNCLVLQELLVEATELVYNSEIIARFRGGSKSDGTSFFA